jgi:nucleoid-associated protein YgaU
MVVCKAAKYLNAPSTRSQAVNRVVVTNGSLFTEAETELMGNETGKPDFSDVRSEVRSQAAQMPPAAKADFSDVQSHVSSTLDENTNYIVKKGDNLSKIARHFYGNANAWKSIFEANRDQLADPDHIQPGQILKMPPKP